MTHAATLPLTFVWRRIHSLMGLFIVLFLIEHLITNSQAALWIGDQGQGFVRMVNWLHNLPYLEVIEFTLIGIPILVHAIWGIKILMTSKANSFRSDGSKPSLPQYERNHAYTLQRITSWILLITLTIHVVKFRFIEYPDTLQINGKTHYFLKVTDDPGLAKVAERLEVNLIAPEVIEKKGVIPWIKNLFSKEIKSNQIIIETTNFGTATLMGVRDTFKSYAWCTFYTLFVLAATFHAFNGLWTFLITWGLIFRYAAQKAMVKFAYSIMVLLAFLGLIAVWGTYWINLKS